MIVVFLSGRLKVIIGRCFFFSERAYEFETLVVVFSVVSSASG